MSLAMRPTGLGHGYYKDSIDFAVFNGDSAIGRIYERHGFAPEVRFFILGLAVMIARCRPAPARSI
jgi:hypothetical protein